MFLICFTYINDHSQASGSIIDWFCLKDNQSEHPSYFSVSACLRQFKTVCSIKHTLQILSGNNYTSFFMCAAPVLPCTCSFILHLYQCYLRKCYYRYTMMVCFCQVLHDTWKNYIILGFYCLNRRLLILDKWMIFSLYLILCILIIPQIDRDKDLWSWDMI